jgi:hypothetical protein
MRASDLMGTARSEYDRDDALFIKKGREYTPLKQGHTISRGERAMCVVDESRMFKRM